MLLGMAITQTDVDRMLLYVRHSDAAAAAAADSHQLHNLHAYHTT